MHAVAWHLPRQQTAEQVAPQSVVNTCRLGSAAEALLGRHKRAKAPSDSNVAATRPHAPGQTLLDRPLVSRPDAKADGTASLSVGSASPAELGEGTSSPSETAEASASSRNPADDLTTKASNQDACLLQCSGHIQSLASKGCNSGQAGISAGSNSSSSGNQHASDDHQDNEPGDKSDLSSLERESHISSGGSKEHAGSQQEGNRTNVTATQASVGGNGGKSSTSSQRESSDRQGDLTDNIPDSCGAGNSSSSSSSSSNSDDSRGRHNGVQMLPDRVVLAEG